MSGVLVERRSAIDSCDSEIRGPMEFGMAGLKKEGVGSNC